MVWDGEGCTNGAGSPLPDASTPSAYNPYTAVSSNGVQMNTGSSLGYSSFDLTQEYGYYLSGIDGSTNEVDGSTSGFVAGTIAAPLGGLICAGSGICEIAVGVIVVGGVFYGAWELGTWIGSNLPMAMGGRQTNHYNDEALKLVQEGLYPGECAALAALLKAAKTSAERLGIIQAQKYAGCRNAGKAR
jgi:hypothetical protein